MLIMSNLKWRSGLVAFIKDAKRLSACIRTPDDRYSLIFSEGVFISHNCPWQATRGLWDNDPTLWVGSQDVWDALRALSKTPEELVENAMALTAGNQAAQASDDATILDFLESCGISAPDLEGARKIVIHTLDEARELRAKLDREREVHKMCSDSLRSANKRADDAEDRIDRIRSLIEDPEDPEEDGTADDDLVPGGFYRDVRGCLWYHSGGDPDFLFDVCEHRWDFPPPVLNLVDRGAPNKTRAEDVQDMVAMMRLESRV